MGRRSVLLAAVLAVLAACRPPAPAGRPGTAVEVDPVGRGAVLYAAYCGGCHGPEAEGGGPVAAVLGLRPADLRSPGLLARASDEEIVERLLRGTPLRTSPPPKATIEDAQVAALEEYLPVLRRGDWEVLRSGRLVYEGACSPCHGAYGNGEGVLAGMVERWPADLAEARERYTDEGLVAVSLAGFGAMPPMLDTFEPGEARALVAYVRHLSKGYRIYQTYCASCHGDDGLGVHPEDLLPPAIPAPPLDAERLASLAPAERRAKILHMLRREQGVMPHFHGVLRATQLRAIVAYLRAVTGDASSRRSGPDTEGIR